MSTNPDLVGGGGGDYFSTGAVGKVKTVNLQVEHILTTFNSFTLQIKSVIRKDVTEVTLGASLQT